MRPAVVDLADVAPRRRSARFGRGDGLAIGLGALDGCASRREPCRRFTDAGVEVPDVATRDVAERVDGIGADPVAHLGKDLLEGRDRERLRCAGDGARRAARRLPPERRRLRAAHQLGVQPTAAGPSIAFRGPKDDVPPAAPVEPQ